MSVQIDLILLLSYTFELFLLLHCFRIHTSENKSATLVIELTMLQNKNRQINKIPK